jgi:hypothetical protein
VRLERLNPCARETGGFFVIAGAAAVASASSDEALGRYKGRGRYDEWIFSDAGP